MTTRHIKPGRVVEYHTPISTGTIIIQITMNLPTPRVKMFLRSHTNEEHPISLFIDELINYIGDAKTFIEGSSM